MSSHQSICDSFRRDDHRLIAVPIEPDHENSFSRLTDISELQELYQDRMKGYRALTFRRLGGSR